MLRIIQSSNAASAARYYTDGLKRADYYTKAQELESGIWHGQTLALLGLEQGKTETAKQFKALLNNRHPVTGEQLTPRMNAEQSRIPGWDFVFSIPKSCSLMIALGKGDDVLQAFRESVRHTMGEIEKLVATRVRIDSKQEDRQTSNFLWAEFLHDTTRPLSDGIPDPHSHIHAYTLNITHDAEEQRFKAAKIRAIKDNADYFEALFNSDLAQRLQRLGLPVERTAKGWELAHLADPQLLKKFSRRTEEIEKLSKELNITDAKAKDALGALTRNRKGKQISKSELVKLWQSRLTPKEKQAIQGCFDRRNPPPARKVTVADALDYAEAKHFERASIVPKNKIITAALSFGIGSVTPEQVKAEMNRRQFIERQIGNEIRVTTPRLVVEEALLVQRVREGLGTMAPLISGNLKFERDFLSPEQKDAARILVKSYDQVVGLRGVAGSGKTTLLSEVRESLAREGIRMIALSVTADASRKVLREAGFQGADTVAKFLSSKEMQLKSRGQVLLIDEAGTIPTQDLLRILEIAGKSTRVILAGDTGQHTPVGRGDSLRILEAYSGMRVAQVRQIIRQKEDGYKKAVEALSNRNIAAAFIKLDSIGAIIEEPDDEARYRLLAVDYARCLEQTGVAPLVVSPTHAEGRLAIAAIRGQLKESGKLGNDSEFIQYRDLKWEAVERTRPENYTKGQVVHFHQNIPGVKRGSALPVLEVDASKNVWVETATGTRLKLDLSRSQHFRVSEMVKIQMANGDRIKITNGGKDLNGRRVESGTLATIQQIRKDGKIQLTNGLLLDQNFGHWAYGYDTSHSSQGKTAKEVLVAQSSLSFRAGSAEQLYVSISRGQRCVRIYTENRSELQRAVGNTSRRLSALEFTGLGEEFFMNGGLSGKQWTERIAEGKASRQDKLQTHVEKLMTQRKIDPPQEKITSHVAYIEMQRANISADGKSRSKGHPHATNGKKQGQKGIVPDPRGGQKIKAVEVKPANENKQARTTEKKAEKVAQPASKKETPYKHTETAVKTSGKHLAEVVARTKRGAEAIKEGPKRSINFGNVKTTLGELTGNKKTQAAQVKQQATKPTAPKPTPPTPPAPAIRSGK